MATTTLAADPVTAGIGLAGTILQAMTPTLAQEQKLSLLDAYKNRISNIQGAGDKLRYDAQDRDAQLGLGSLTERLLNDAGLAAPGLASIDISVPLDDYEQLLTCAALLCLLVEQQAAGNPSPVAGTGEPALKK